MKSAMRNKSLRGEIQRSWEKNNQGRDLHFANLFFFYIKYCKIVNYVIKYPHI